MPLWPKTSRTLRIWIDKGGENLNRILFPNAGGGTLSTDGATYILDQAVQRAIPSCPSLKTKRVSPHVVRHYLPFRIMSRKNRAFAVWTRI